MSLQNAMQEGPHPVDIYVGQRVRMRRNQLGMSQSTLADGLGLTFQQVQKYERGSNRISTSKLYEIATLLSVPITFFFENVAPGDKIENKPVATLNRHQDYLSSPEGYKLIDAISKLPQPVRSKIVALVTALSTEHELDEGKGSDE